MRRRAGKSFILALIAVFLACFRDWRPYLGPGEVGTVMVIAADRKQARVIMRYVKGLLQSVPMLKQLIQAETRESITLKGRVADRGAHGIIPDNQGIHNCRRSAGRIAYWPTDEGSCRTG